jgi:hypothetical protein
MPDPPLSDDPPPPAPVPPSSSVFERHSRLFVVLLVLVSVLGTDLAFARVHRWLSPHPQAAWPTFRTRSEIYHHGLVPLAHEEHAAWGPRRTDYWIDSLGLRDTSSRTVALESPRRRLVFMGDSFTEGLGVEYEDTFVGRVARALEKDGVEVLNAGCMSYSPVTYFRKTKWLLDEGLRFDDLAVFIDIGDLLDEVDYRLDENGSVVANEARRIREERENLRYQLPAFMRNLAVRQWLKRNTLGLFFLYDQVEQRIRKDEHRQALWTYDPRYFEEYGREGLAHAREHMDMLAALARARGISLTVAVYPWPEQVRHGDPESMPVVVWREWAERSGAGFVNCFPPFLDERHRDEILRDWFIPGDFHWTEAGHAVIADAFLAYWRGRPPSVPPAQPRGTPTLASAGGPTRPAAR